MNGLLICGASGHGKVIADLARKTGQYDKIAFLDDSNALQSAGVVWGNMNFALQCGKDYDVIVAIGNSEIREKIQSFYEKNGLCVSTLVHPSAVLAEHIQIMQGSVVMAGAIIQAEAKIGKGTIINTASSVDHESVIGDYCHIAVGSHLAGNVVVGNHSWVGAGAIISNNITICEKVVLGAGAVVIHDIKESGTYVGVPAKKIR